MSKTTHEKERSKCPAFGKICSACQKENHFALKCSQKKKPHKTKKPRNRKPSHKHSVNQFDFGESEEEILSVSCTEEEMYLADALSRAYQSLSPTDTQRSETEKEVESIHAVDYLAISEQQLSEIKQETVKDPTLQTLKNVILRGWPENSSSVPKEVSEYFNVRDELAVQDGIIFKGQRCVIPKTLRQKVKEKIHRAHIGIQGCLRRAREVVYWPSKNQEITDYIEHCDTCNLYASHPQREPLIVHDVPECPWQKVGCEIFTLDEKDYLCTVDYYSGYFEIDHFERKTARTIITRLKRHFSNHGIPNLFQSDNGPPFDSQELRDFAAAYEFELVTSSPNYPQSNGRVENAVKTAK